MFRRRVECAVGHQKSPTIFIRLAAADGRAFDQLQLQAFVYVAHGWCLALYDQPLTGDRPEAWEFGPMYRRLAAALAPYGRTRVTREILKSEAFEGLRSAGSDPARSELDAFETELIADIYQNYATLESWQLSALTRKGDTPWKQVFGDGRGQFRDIPHDLIRAQFVELLRQSEESKESP
jgi:uncharacterized phage-associated protein